MNYKRIDTDAFISALCVPGTIVIVMAAIWAIVNVADKLGW